MLASSFGHHRVSGQAGGGSFSGRPTLLWPRSARQPFAYTSGTPFSSPYSRPHKRHLSSSELPPEDRSRADVGRNATVNPPGDADLPPTSHSGPLTYGLGTASVDEDDWAYPASAAATVGRALYDVLSVSRDGTTRRMSVKRRDLLRLNGLLPRDLRRVDPTMSPTRTSASISIRSDVLLFNLGGVRAIVNAERALLFEPESPASRQLLQVIMPRLQASASAERLRRERTREDEEQYADALAASKVPFELEMLEGALVVSMQRLDGQLMTVTARAANIIQDLPNAITPVNLEELRRVKQSLVELESRSDTTRQLLEDIMDDEDELREFNLSSRPKREERRKLREREKLSRGMQRLNQERASLDGGSFSSLSSLDGLSPPPAGQPPPFNGSETVDRTHPSHGTVQHFASTPEGTALVSSQSREPGAEPGGDPGTGAVGLLAPGSMPGVYGEEEERLRGGSNDAEDAWVEMQEQEQEEAELEEVQDLLEYYVQRATTTQSEAERLLDGARDLEESIGVSLSARRLEVVRLELMLSIASFAAAVGAMIAGIFGMNLTSTLEASVVGFWGVTIGTLFLCGWIYVAILKYTRNKRILN